MKIFADHCVHTDTINLLKNLGHKVQRALDVGMEEAFDEQIFAHAQKTKQILLTFDKDFGNITHFDILKSKGVIVVYVHRMSKDIMNQNVQAFFAKRQPKILAGKLFIIQTDSVRVWPKK